MPPEPPPAAPGSIIFTPGSVTLNAIGDQQQFEARVRDQNGRDLPDATVAWSSTQPTVAEIDRSSGLATATGPGTATIRAAAGRVAMEGSLTVVQLPRGLERTEGDGQQGFFGEALPVSPAVRVLDANEHPAQGITIAFQVTSGGGSVSAESVDTGTDGVARTEWTMGEDSVQTLSATVEELTTEFMVTAVQPPLEILTDSLDWGRLTVSYSAELTAEGGSRSGYVWSLSEQTALPGGLEITADGMLQGTPLETGVSEFDVRVSDSDGNETVATLGMRVCDGPLGLAVGDVRVVDPDALAPCGFFIRADEAGAYYRVTFAGVVGASEFFNPVALRVEGPPGEAAAAGPVVAGETPERPGPVDEDWATVLEIELANAALHRKIRQHEEELMEEMRARGSFNILPDRPVAQAQRTTGAPVTFKLYDGDSGASRCTVDQTVVADVIAENDHFVVYEEVDATAKVSADNANTMIDFYSEHGAEIIDRYFGGVSDVNGDGKITLLVDPALDGIQAYVWSADMTLSATDCASSNQMELVHMSRGAFDQFNDDDYWALSALVHEAKHVSSLYKRVVNNRRRGSVGRAFHPTWVEEGTAEIAKEMSSRLAWERAGGPAMGERAHGDTLRTAIRETRPQVYGVFSLMARVVRAFSPDPNAITYEPSGLGNVYGSGWHFHRLLRDRTASSGEGFNHAMDEAFVAALNDSLTVPGIEGIEDITGLSMAELLESHAVAMTVAGSEDWLTDDQVPRFLSYDFPTTTEVFVNPDPPGRYPWPATLTGDNDFNSMAAAELGTAGRFEGRVTSNGLRVHDFEAMGEGASAIFHPTVSERVVVIVARIVKPPGF